MKIVCTAENPQGTVEQIRSYLCARMTAISHSAELSNKKEKIEKQAIARFIAMTLLEFAEIEFRPESTSFENDEAN